MTPSPESDTTTPGGVLPPHVPLTAYYADEPARHRFVRRIFDDTASDYDRIEKVLALGSGPGTAAVRCAARI
jgi:demethylmenaquinone methyltransferase/2-methoxy-6-polyprenyl-1,4-benzoquinol methylase